MKMKCHSKVKEGRKQLLRESMIDEINKNKPSKEDNSWFLEISKQSQIDIIMNSDQSGEFDLWKLKYKTLKQINRNLKNKQHNE